MWKLLAADAAGALPSVAMWMIARSCGAALAVALALAGCVPTPAPSTGPPQPNATPVFASEAEALAAATKAYAAYVKVSDEILADGGAGPERIREVATGEALEGALSGYGDFRVRKLHSVGKSTIDHVSLQQLLPRSQDAPDTVSIYACLDLTGVDVVDGAGGSVVSPQRPSRQPFQVTLNWNASDRRLLVASREPWTDGGVCEEG